MIDKDRAKLTLVPAELDAYDQTEDAKDEATRVDTQFLHLPFPALDKLVGGIGQGELWFIGAYSGHGKTTFLMSALDLWFERGARVYFMGLENSGLCQGWSGDRVWCNPPYSDCAAWVTKAWEEMLSGCLVVAMLLPANRTEQKWWQSSIEPYRDGRDPRSFIRLRVDFLPGRIRFDRPGWTKPTKGDRPPFGLCTLVWELAS